MPIVQGEVYRYLPTENRGPTLENEFRHRALIVSGDEYNQGNHIVIILFTTKKNHLPQRPSWVRFPADEQFGLDEDCIAQGESLTRAPPRYLGERLGRISDEKLGEVVEAIGYVMNASCFLSFE
jgi:mRNA-degrading endonuclease toxin of MazEF toxin-antitoxin module